MFEGKQPVKVRRTYSEDAPLIDELLARAYPTLMAEAYRAEVLSVALPFLIKSSGALLKSGTYYVAEETGHILGCGGLTLEHPGTSEVTPGIAHLRHFATDPACVRQGVGRTIFRECAQAAAKAGAKMFQAYSSLNAEPFYKSLGLTRIRQIDLPRPSTVSIPAILMEGPIKVEG
jgi:N-acetylglutamate synthase-like GNAT family acetyltransferase